MTRQKQPTKRAILINTGRFVYVARAQPSGLIKIGSSTDPKRRVVTFQYTYELGEKTKLLFYFFGGFKDEFALHKRFKAYRHHGEWFHEKGELAAYIKQGLVDYKKHPKPKWKPPSRTILTPQTFCVPAPRLVGYARVSTEEQVLDMQITALKNAGVQDEDLFAEKVSAAYAKRPYFHLMMKHLWPGDTLVVYSFSRIKRNLKEVLTVVDTLKAKNIRIVSTTEPHIDCWTTNGRFLLSIVGAVDENESGRTRDRTKDGMNERRRQGMFMGRPVLVTPEDAKEMKHQRFKMGIAAPIIARQFDVSVSAVYQHTNRK